MLSTQKKLAEQVLTPLIKPLSGVNPNILTLLGSIPSLLFFVFLLNHWYILALIAFLGNLFDMVDGMIARKYNKVTAFGGFLDSTLDRISDFLMITAFAFAGIISWNIIAPVLLLSFLISYIRSRGELAKPSVSFAVGLIERTERLILIILALILYIIFPGFSTNNMNLAEIVFIMLGILSFYTFLQRTIYAYKNL